MKLLLALPSFLLLAPLSLALLAQPAVAAGDPDCVTVPIRQRIAHGVYLQQLVLHCEKRPTPQEQARADLDVARDWIALCRDAGGSAAGCAQALAAHETPDAGQALRDGASLRAATLEPIASPLPEPPTAAAPRWQTPRLFTNRAAAAGEVSRP